MDTRLKIAATWFGVFAFRFFLLPLRAPNVEPLLASVMPLSRVMNGISSFAFAALSIAAYDAVTSGIGVWTLVTAGAYGALGLAAHAYFQGRVGTRAQFVGFGIVGTLAYDAATGLTVGPLAFGQPFMGALLGQIPFTLLHLAGTVLFALVLSPILARWLATSEVRAAQAIA